jgi:hypothetical protein
MFSRTVSVGSRLKNWNNPIVRAAARKLIVWRERVRAAQRTVPADGRAIAPARCSSVDFPQPDGPARRHELARGQVQIHTTQRPHGRTARIQLLDVDERKQRMGRVRHESTSMRPAPPMGSGTAQRDTGPCGKRGQSVRNVMKKDVTPPRSRICIRDRVSSAARTAARMGWARTRPIPPTK